MITNFRRVFFPTEEEKREDMNKYKLLYDELKTKKGCSTCKHCIHVIDLPGVTTGEECECNAGLECDTVMFSVENCPRWMEKGRTAPEDDS